MSNGNRNILKMKFIIVLLLSLACVSAMPQSQQNDIKQADLSKNFLNILNDIFLPPIQGALQTVAELLAQVTAGIAVGGIDAIQSLIG